jgi:hypothetical protein
MTTGVLRRAHQPACEAVAHPHMCGLRQKITTHRRSTPPPPPPAHSCVVRGAKGPAPALDLVCSSHKDVIIPASPIPVAHVKTRIAADHAPHHGEAASQTRRAQ